MSRSFGIAGNQCFAGDIVLNRESNAMTDDLKFMTTPMDDALFRFDAENNVEPPRRIAARIASKYGVTSTHPLVDDISHAIEDAMELGHRRAPYVRS